MTRRQQSKQKIVIFKKLFNHMKPKKTRKYKVKLLDKNNKKNNNNYTNNSNNNKY